MTGDEGRERLVGSADTSGCDLAHLSSLIAVNDLEAAETWAAVKSNLPWYSSKAGKTAKDAFAMEMLIVGRSKIEGLGRQEISVSVAEKGERRIFLALQNGVRPISFLTSGHLFNLNPGLEEWSHFLNFDWSFAFGREFTMDFLKIWTVDPDKDGSLLIDTPAWVSLLMDDVTPTPVWDGPSRSLILDKRNGTQVRIRLRSPEDARRYGTALGGILYEVRGEKVVNLQSFQRGGELQLVYGFADPQEIDRVVKARRINVPQDAAVSINMNAQVDSPSVLAASERMSHALQAAGRAVQPGQKELWPDRVLLIAMAKAASQPALLAPLESEPRLRQVVAEDLAGQLAALADALPGDNGRPLDDPAMIALQAQAAVTPERLLEACAGLQQLLLRDDVDVPAKLALLDAFGDLGYPAFLGDGGSFDTRTPHRLMQAILYSRWGWPCDEEHFDACRQALDSAQAGGEIERVAIETLIRLDAADRMLPATVHRWYEQEVCAATPARRRQSLAVMSAVPTGRAALLRELTAEDDEAVRETIVKVLRSRVEATVATGLVDFMSDAERTQVLAAIGD